MHCSPKFSVAFAFSTNGKEWYGGRNYFRSLFLALQSLPHSSVQPIALIGTHTNIDEFDFPINVKFIKDSALDLNGPKGFINKISIKLFGTSWLTNRAVLRHGIGTISHGFPSGDSKIKSIGWIPDFQHVHLPQFFQEKELKSRNRLYFQFLKKCDLVVVSSESARQDLRRYAPSFAHKARVLRFCAVRPIVNVDDAINVRSTYKLNGRFFYIPNQAWAHKNHVIAIRALSQLVDEYTDIKIVCSGGLDDYRNPKHFSFLNSEVQRLGLADRFIFLGVIAYQDIAKLMLQAVAVINPSLFEGWSTTVEEAKALGVPLILSGIDVHREQCEDGEAIFFDPKDPTELAKQMRSKLSIQDGRSQSMVVHEALVKHRLRAEEFARTYEQIVAELHGLIV